MEQKSFVDLEEVTKEDLADMVQAKVRELTELRLELAELRDENAKVVQEKNNIASRAMKVHEENNLMKAAPELAVEMARMEYQLRMAKQFTSAGAFPKLTPEQAYTIMQAGAEMGMKPLEALNGLYIVNGAINPHGKAMPARIKNAGYQIQYASEDAKHCTVRVFNDEGEDFTETARADDPILVHQSKFMKISPRNKMRYHALRAIINFHLPHIYGSVSDMFSDAVQQIEEEQPKGIEAQKDDKRRARVAKAIDEATSLTELAKASPYIAQLQLQEEYEAKLNQFADEAMSHEKGDSFEDSVQLLFKKKDIDNEQE